MDKIRLSRSKLGAILEQVDYLTFEPVESDELRDQVEAIAFEVDNAVALLNLISSRRQGGE